MKSLDWITEEPEITEEPDFSLISSGDETQDERLERSDGDQRDDNQMKGTTEIINNKGRPNRKHRAIYQKKEKLSDSHNWKISLAQFILSETKKQAK